MSVPPQRASYERIAVDALALALADVPGIQVYRGQAAGNRFSVAGWGLTVAQQFQFGDLRVEAPAATIVVEFESAGGVGNLVKYWPLLAARPSKRFVITHIYQLGSANDYIAHRQLWGYLVERMRESLAHAGVAYPEDWEARIFTYRPAEPAADAAAFVRDSCLQEAGP